MVLTQIIDSLVRIAEAEDPKAIWFMNSLVESYLAENRSVLPADLLKPVFAEFQKKTDHLYSKLSMKMLQILADRIQ